jgi:hypothetical protein
MTDAPRRIQRSRAKGWRMPQGAVYVGRPSKWGNPWTRSYSAPIDPCIRFACETVPLWPAGWEAELRGKDLVCWCALDAPCHADLLLELANAPLRREGEDG